MKLTNTAGNENLASITLATVDTTTDPDTVLSTDATNGLQMKIEKCGGAGLEGVGHHSVHLHVRLARCGRHAGTRTTVLARRAIIGSSLALST